MSTRTQQTVGGLVIPLLALLLAGAFAPGNPAEACPPAATVPPTAYIANWVITLFDERPAALPTASLPSAGGSETMAGSLPSAD